MYLCNTIMGRSLAPRCHWRCWHVVVVVAVVSSPLYANRRDILHCLRRRRNAFYTGVDFFGEQKRETWRRRCRWPVEGYFRERKNRSKVPHFPSANRVWRAIQKWTRLTKRSRDIFILLTRKIFYTVVITTPIIMYCVRRKGQFLCCC